MAATFGQFPDKFWFSGALLRRERELQKTFPVLRTGTGNKKGFPAFWDWNRKSQTSIPLFGNRKNMPTAFWPFLCLTPFSSCHLLLTSNVFFTLVYHPISTCLTFTTSVASYFHKCYVSLCDCNHLLFWILPADPVFFNYFPPASVYPLTYHHHLLTLLSFPLSSYQLKISYFKEIQYSFSIWLLYLVWHIKKNVVEKKPYEYLVI